MGRLNHIVDIFGIGWLLGLIAQGLSGWGGGWEGEPYCRQRVKCNQLSDNATTRLTSSWNQRNNGTIEAIRKGGDEHDCGCGRQKHLFFLAEQKLNGLWDPPPLLLGYALNCVKRAPLLYFIRSWVALSFKVVSQWVSQSGIGNTCPDLHFLQYIKAWMSSTDTVSSITNCYHLIVSYTDPVHSFIISERTVESTGSSVGFSWISTKWIWFSILLGAGCR